MEALTARRRAQHCAEAVNELNEGRRVGSHTGPCLCRLDLVRLILEFTFVTRLPSMNDLIIDVGMHRGKDTEFYLAKGFRVVGVEANPALVRQVETRLGAHLAAGRLRIYNLAVAERTGILNFWVNEQNDDWGTADDQFAKRNSDYGTTNRQIMVPCRPFGEILDECGTPYYLKIDIEGSDLLCVEALRERERPKYVSVEAALNSFDEIFTQLSVLWSLGYRSFKIVNQGLNHKVRCPDPPREGCYVDARFDKYCSGPFGEEAPGKWHSADRILAASRPLVRDQRYCGINAPYSRSVWGRCYKRFKEFVGRPVAWYDIHARLGPAVA